MIDTPNKGNLATLLTLLRLWQSPEWKELLIGLQRANGGIEAHTKGPWRPGRVVNGGAVACVVANHPVPEVGGSDEIHYYGGHLICESVSKANAARIAACVNACEGIPTSVLLAMASALPLAAPPIAAAPVQIP